MSSAAANRAVRLGLSVNFLLAIVKGIAGISGNSNALLADAMESFGDVAGSMVVLFALRFAAKPPDHNHPYGHGKAEPLAAALVAIMLFGAAIFIALDSFHQIQVSHPGPEPYTLVVLVGTIVVKEFLYRRTMSIGKTRESLAVQGDAWHNRSDSITSAAAFIGISVALLGGPQYAGADDWAALFASILIAWNGFHILTPALLELTDAAPEAEVEVFVRRVTLDVRGVLGVEKVFIRKMGTMYFVDLHLEVDGELTVREGHSIAHLVKDALRKEKANIKEVLVHVEPYENRP